MTYSASLHATCTGREFEPNPCACCCTGCLYNCTAHDPNHGNCQQPARLWWSAGWDGAWWAPLILAGIHGGDEWCNRTVGLRLPGGALFLALNIPLRRESCGECLALLPAAVPNNQEARP